MSERRIIITLGPVRQLEGLRVRGLDTLPLVFIIDGGSCYHFYFTRLPTDWFQTNLPVFTSQTEGQLRAQFTVTRIGTYISTGAPMRIVEKKGSVLRWRRESRGDPKCLDGFPTRQDERRVAKILYPTSSYLKVLVNENSLYKTRTDKKRLFTRIGDKVQQRKWLDRKVVSTNV